MARGKFITIEQETKLIELYSNGVSIKEIMKETGIKSEQTVYRLLDQNDIPRRPKLIKAAKVFVVLEKDSLDIVRKQPNMSYYINEAIRYYHKMND